MSHYLYEKRLLFFKTVVFRLYITSFYNRPRKLHKTLAMNSKVSFVLFFYCILSYFPLLAQDSHGHVHHEANGPLKYIANHGQWNSKVLFESKIEKGSVYLESDGLTFSQYDPKDLARRSELYHAKSADLKSLTINGHAWKVNFVGANKVPTVLGSNKLSEYRNYFIGNDSSKWAGNVGVYQGAEYKDLYAGIDLKTYSEDGHFKYDFLVQPKANAKDIQLEYQGLKDLYIRKGHLILVTSVGDFKEMKPYAYQIVDGIKREVKCDYKLVNKTLSYVFPDGYNEEIELIIDPVLIAATLSGTTGFDENYGHCATFDNAGNIFTGAINFTTGYPVTLGAFQVFNAGGVRDIAISKFNPTGSNLLFATYIGGMDEEYPHSLIVNANDELFVLATTNSFNFPTTVGAYDNTLNGDFDISIVHLNAAGSGLIGSTFVGGSFDDGLNFLPLSSMSITGNYGDEFRGEIILDAAGNCYIASTSSSADFPTTAGAYQTGHGGGTLDAVIFKMPPNLNTIIWSTFLGSAGEEAAFGLRLDAAGDVYACGVTTASFMVGNGYQPAFAGGTDGFVVKLTNNGSTMPFRTYVGTAFFDNSFFLEIDGNGKIYVYGQTENGVMTTTPGTYSVPNSGQYIIRYSANLATRELCSLIGAGSNEEFVPIALMVDNCGYIYFSGHRGESNTLAVLPNSPNAFQTTGGFYLGVLSPNATSLYYATHYAGPDAHVDGGTSRFDPNGIIYQAVCSGGGFATTPTAYAPTQSGLWDIGVFKIDFQLNPQAGATYTFAGGGCAPAQVNFINYSNATSYLWDFGDGSPTSTLTNPSHTYVNPGTYNVMLVAVLGTSCVVSDTTYLQIVVPAGIVVDLGPDLNICSGTTVLDAGIPGATYLWQDGSTNQTYTVSGPGLYYVTVNSGPCSATDSINITYGNMTVNLGPDGTICSGGTTILDAGNPGSTYLWSDNSTNQTLSVSASGTYWVTVTGNSCNGSDTIVIDLSTNSPDFSLDDTVGCSPLLTQFIDLSTASSAINSRLWNFGDGGISTQQNPTHQYVSSGIYTVTLTVTNADGCVTTYTQNVNITILPTPLADFSFSPNDPQSGDEIIFTDESINALNWAWDFGDGVTSTIQNPTHIFTEINDFDVTLVVENNGCFDSISANISFGEPLIYYVPNAFTPDADAHNNVFQPIFTSGFSPYKYHLYIYDRWGELIFESLDPTASWDGTYGGRICQQGAYTWKIEFGVEETDKKHMILGHVMLLK